MAQLPHPVLKGYELLEPIGAGGFGTVYRAYQAVVGREVAVKAIAPEYASNPEFIRRFEVEARLVARLEHPHIVPLYDYWCDAEGAYLVMRWLPRSLRDALTEGPLPLEGVVRLLEQIAAALGMAHRQQIIHRDIKPENILLDDENNAYLADFGIAKDLGHPGSTGEQRLVGTLAYLTPEQINGGPITPRTDLYSLGLTLYEALTSEKAFGDSTPSALLFNHLNMPLPSVRRCCPDLPPALDTILQKATAKQSEARYPDVIRFAEAFRAAIAVPTPKVYQLLPDPLTERELEILRLMASERSNAEIAEALFITPGTVKWYVKQIYSKLDVHSREEAIICAHELHLLAVEIPPLSATSASVVSSPSVSIHRTVFSLPAQAIPFVGRESELADLNTLLTSATVRLVTILAPGGMGKTRLAIEAAERQKSHYANGACFVALAAVESTAYLISAIAQAAHFTFYDGSDPKQQLLDYFRAKQLLLVLDNFEHLLDGAPLLTDMLNAAPGLRILVTSRERLNLSTETVFNLGGLELPEMDVADACECSAVRFFLECAARVRHGCQAASDDMAYVVAICQRVGGMPLGILLAALWIELLSPREIAEELARNLDILETEWRDLPERQHSLRIIFRSTWEQLTEGERALFMKLSVFSGGFTSRAAQAVTGASLRTLAALVNKALLTRDDEGRCTIHELLRQYAAEQLEDSGQAEATRDAHSSYYLDWLREGKPDLEGHNQLTMLKAIRADLENIRAAWTWGIVRRDYARLAETVHALWLFFYIQGRHVDSERFFAEAATRLRAAPAASVRDSLLGDILIRWAWFNGLLDRFETLERLVQESATLTDLADSPGARAYRMALTAIWIGSYIDRAALVTREAMFADALNLCRSLDLQSEAAQILYWQGLFGWDTEDPELYDAMSRIPYLREAQAIYTNLGDVFGQALALNGLGLVAGWYQRDMKTGIQFLRDSLALRRRFGANGTIANSLRNISIFQLLSGQSDAGIETMQEVIHILYDLGDNIVLTMSWMIAFLGQIPQGQFAEAQKRFEDVLRQAEQNDRFDLASDCLRALTRLDWLRGDFAQAAERNADHLNRLATTTMPRKYIDTVVPMFLGADIALISGDLVTARAYASKAEQELRSRESRQPIDCELLYGELAFLEGNYAEARQKISSAWTYFRGHYPLAWNNDSLFRYIRAPRMLSAMALAVGELDTALGYVCEVLRCVRRHSGMILAGEVFALSALVAMVEWLTATSQHERAAQLAALIAADPRTPAVDRDAVMRLTNTLRGDVQPCDVHAIVEALLQEYDLRK